MAVNQVQIAIVFERMAPSTSVIMLVVFVPAEENFCNFRIGIDCFKQFLIAVVGVEGLLDFDSGYARLPSAAAVL